MRHITLSYTLRDGTRGRMPCIAATSADAVLQALQRFGDDLRACSARPGGTPQAIGTPNTNPGFAPCPSTHSSPR